MTSTARRPCSPAYCRTFEHDRLVLHRSGLKAHSISATGQSDTDVSNAARATMKLLARARTSCPAVSSLTTLTVLRQQIRSCPTGLVAARVDQPPPDQARSA